MPYEIHIARPISEAAAAALPKGDPLAATARYRELKAEVAFSLNEWIAAVEATPNARIVQGAQVTLSDGTRMAVKPGAVEVLVDGAWTYAMRFQNGTGIFNVAGWMWVPSDPRRKAAAAIANKLGAEIRNDDWELYEW